MPDVNSLAGYVKPVRFGYAGKHLIEFGSDLILFKDVKSDS